MVLKQEEENETYCFSLSIPCKGEVNVALVAAHRLKNTQKPSPCRGRWTCDVRAHVSVRPLELELTCVDNR